MSAFLILTRLFPLAIRPASISYRTLETVVPPAPDSDMRPVPKNRLVNLEGAGL